MKVVIIVGNPKKNSKTSKSAENMAAALGVGADSITLYELSDISDDLFDWESDIVSACVSEAAGADLVIVASPTFKGAYTGLTKLFLDAFPYKGLSGVVAIPLMLGASQAHAMSVDLQLRPVLVELGASCPTSGLYIVDQEYNDNNIYSNFVSDWEHVLGLDQIVL